MDYEMSESQIKKNYSRLVKLLLPYKSKGELLEIGCAYGYFLDTAKNYWNVSGVDISNECTAQCSKRFGSKIFCGELVSLNLQKEFYDLIVAWDTIEHLNNPREYLYHSFSLLKKGGCLFLTTGDVSSLIPRIMGKYWRLMTPPSHLTFFSKHGVEQLLSEIGFKNIVFQTLGYERSLAFTFFRLLGKKHYNSIIRHLPGFEKWLSSKSFYIDLKDIMFVIAKKI